MISAWNLLWIIPVAEIIGFVAAAFCRAAKGEER